MKFLLRLPPWLMFVLVVGIPLVVPAFVFVYGNKMVQDGYTSTGDFIVWMAILNLAMLCGAVFFYFAWLSMAGTHLYKLVAETKLNLAMFRMSFLGHVFFCIGALILITRLRLSPSFFSEILLLVPLFLICLVYQLNFIGKLMLQIETGTEQTKIPVFEILMMVLFPIGVWNIQLRVNRIFSKVVEAKETPLDMSVKG